MSAEHEFEAHYARAWNEYRTECSCGYVGSYWPSEDHARREHLLHVEAEAKS